MPNATIDSSLHAAIKILVTILEASERSRLQTWMLAKYDVSGYPKRGFDDRGSGSKDPAH